MNFKSILTYSKSIAALVGSIVTALLGVLPPAEYRWLVVVGVVATAVTTYVVPNVPNTPAATPAASVPPAPAK